MARAEAQDPSLWEWILVWMAGVEILGSFIYLTLGDLMAAVRLHKRADMPWDPDT